MFRKLVANLPFSPALVGQLGFYARRLKKEQAARQLGLVFTALAIAVQSFAMIQPPEAANAAAGRDCSDNSIMRCGVQNVQEFTTKYTQNVTGDLGAIYDSYGLSAAVINSGNVKMGVTYKNGDVAFNGQVVAKGASSLGRQNTRGSQYATNIGGRTYYSTPNQVIFKSNAIQILGFFDQYDNFIAGILLDCGNPVRATRVTTNQPPPPPAAQCDVLQLVALSRNRFKVSASGSASNGASIKQVFFNVTNSAGTSVFSKYVDANNAVTEFELADAGNYTARATMVTTIGDRTSEACAKPLTVAEKPMCPQNPSLPADSPECKPCEGNEEVWYKDKTCKPEITLNKKSVNLTQNGVDATTVTAKPGDRIQYTLSAKNNGNASDSQLIVDRIDDITQYAVLQDSTTGTYDKEKGTISFGEVTIKPKETITRTFTIQVMNQIPTTPAGTIANPASYDCKMANVFGDSVNINVECPPEKQVETVVSQLPSTGPGENIAVGTTVLMVVTYFFVRARQKAKEVRLIRHDFNMGAI